MTSAFVASQSSCFFLYSREQIRQVENRLNGGVLIVLTCSWELSWIAKDAAQRDRGEGFLKAPLAATSCLITEHSYTAKNSEPSV